MSFSLFYNNWIQWAIQMKILGFVNFVIVDKVEYGGSVWLVELWPVSKKKSKKSTKKVLF